MNPIEQAIEALERWAALIKHQYSGSSEAMTALQDADNFGQQSLDALKAYQQAAQDVELPLDYLAELAKMHSASFASPHHFTLSVVALRRIVVDAIAAHQARQAVPQVIHQHGFAADNARLRAINESLDKQIEEVMAERDARDDVLARIASLIDAEFTSAYGFADLEQELEERIAAAPQPEATKETT